MPADRAPADRAAARIRHCGRTPPAEFRSSKYCKRSIIAAQIARQQFDRHVRQPIVHRLRRIACSDSAPPSARSSRLTTVITTCASPIRSTAAASCSGSFASGGSGLRQRLDAAKPAAARALLAGDHERRRAARPAVVEIRAAGLFAHRVQAVVCDRMVRRIENCQRLPGRQIHAQPLRQRGRVDVVASVIGAGEDQRSNWAGLLAREGGSLSNSEPSTNAAPHAEISPATPA